jgi:hypothetical protein
MVKGLAVHIGSGTTFLHCRTNLRDESGVRILGQTRTEIVTAGRFCDFDFVVGHRSRQVRTRAKDGLFIGLLFWNATGVFFRKLWLESWEMG